MIISDNFTPFFGLVEDVLDPEKEGRLRIRVFVYNHSNKAVLPTDILKWFKPVVPGSVSVNGVGTSPTGYDIGSLVFGFYVDQDKQNGIILGSLPGQGDVSTVAKGDNPQEYIDRLNSDRVESVETSIGSWSEPETSYASVYPNNKVIQTKSGHIIEIDDTPGAERIVVLHKSGTYEEIHPDGKKVERIKGQSFEVYLGGNNIYVNGDLNLSASGNYNIKVNGDYNIQVGGNYNTQVDGSKNSDIKGPVNTNAPTMSFDTSLLDISGESVASDHISSGISGNSHTHGGVQSGPSSTGVPQ